MKAIILMAGMSSRLRLLTKDKPKSLLRIGNSTILERQLDALISCGVGDIVLVTGYKGEKVEEFVDDLETETRIRIVLNEDYEITENGYSLLMGLGNTDESVIILDGDVLFDPSLLKDLINMENCLVVDDQQRATNEDCKVEVSEGYATGIGKEKQSDLIYTSIAKLDGIILSELRGELSKNHEWYSGPLGRVLQRNPRSVRVMPTGGRWRFEIDTIADLREALRCILM